MPFSAPSGSSLAVAAEQNTNFTAAKFKEHPVDMSGFPTVSQLIVTPPSNPNVNDVFAVFDSRVVCDLHRVIVIDFSGGVLHSLPNDYAVINNPGSRIEFKYISTTLGWRVASNIN